MSNQKNISYYGIFVIAILLFIMGFSVIIGWNTGNLWLAKIQPKNIAMVYNTALCFLFVAVGLLGFCAKQKWLSLTAAIIILFISILTLIEFIFPASLSVTHFFSFTTYDVHNGVQGRMAPNTAVNFILIAIAYLVMVIKKDVPFVWLAIAGLISFFVTNLAIFFFTGYLIELETLYGWSPFTPMAFSTSLTFIISGVGLMFLVWYCGGIHQIKLRKLIPVGVFLSAIIINLLLFRALYIQEKNTNLKILLANQKSIVNSTITILQDHIGVLERMTSRWETLSGMNENIWRNDAIGVLKGYAGYLAIELVTPDFKIKWIEPHNKYKHMEGMTLGVPYQFNNIAKHSSEKQAVFVYKAYHLMNKKADFILQAPLLVHNQISGFLLGYINEDIILRNFIKINAADYVINIWGGDELLYTNFSEQAFQKKYKVSKEFYLNGLPIRVDIYPTNHMLGQENDFSLAYFVLVLGLITISLFFACYLLLLKITSNSLSLTETQQKLMRAQSIAKLGSWIWYPKKQKVWCSSETLIILGLNPKNSILDEKDFFEYIHPAQQEIFKSALSDLISKNINTYSETYTLKVGEKEHTIRFEIDNQNSNSDDEIEGILQDISKIRQLEMQLYQAQKMEVIGQLTGGLAHDFNNMLMVIQGNLELLMMALQGKATELKRIESALNAVERGAELTKRLLAFARRQLLQPKLVDLSALITDMTKLIKPMLSEAVEFNVIMPENLWSIWVDVGQLENSIMNLIVNARDAIAGNGKITIEISNISLDSVTSLGRYDIAPGDYVKISISDNGVGISKENLNKVFEPFFTTKQTGKGSGLGLSMVYGFVKQSKGHVSIYSEVGYGTTVNLYLPRATPKQTTTPGSAKQVINTEAGGNETILVVEDEVELLRLNIDFLKGLGYRVLSAANGVEALKVVESEPNIQLLCTDVVMPQGMTGPDLAKKLLEIYPAIKVLFVSGYTQNALSKNYIIPEETTILTKPYKIHELAATIRELLDEK